MQRLDTRQPARRWVALLTWGLLAALAAGSPVQAAPAGSAFTYQGSLADGALPASGSFNLRFRLYDAATAGGQIGATVSHSSVPVAGGLFTVVLDFGVGAFQGDARWLEIDVQPDVPGGLLTTLSPRQPLTPVPYALFALGGVGGGAYWQASGTHITNTNTGNVGIGVATPTQKLTVGGRGDFHDQVDAVRGVTVHRAPGAASARASIFNANLLGSEIGGQLHTWDEANRLTAMFGSSTGDGGWAYLFSSDGFPGVIANGGTTKGDVGVWNSGNERTVFINGDEGDGGADIALHSGRDQTVQIDAHVNGSGYIGLGTADGQGSVEIRGDEGDGGSNIAMKVGGSTRLELDAESPGDGSNVILRNHVGIGTVLLDSQENANAGEVHVKGEFGQFGVSIYGDFGDGHGRVVTDVLEITGGADLSERFDIAAPAQQPIVPGTVVCIDPSAPGRLAVSTRAHDKRVAGIVSGAGGVAPGMLMGQNGTLASGAHPVALTGRVYCQADASNGPIEPGDLLTTSDVPGHAMKAQDPARAQGAILGKAMTPLAEGRGLVLVGLQ